jgi:zinc protease
MTALLTPRTRHSLPGADDIHREVLANGITVLSRSNFNSPSVSISGYLQAGSLAEPDEKLGLADFMTSALMRGTEKHSFDEIYNRLESCGAGFGYDSGAHTTSFGGRSLAEDLPLLLDLFSETIRTPTFPDVEVEKLRNHLLTGLAIRSQDTSDMADLVFDQILFDGHPYGRPSDGWPDTIQSITRDDLINFHRAHIGPRGMVIVIVGGIDPPQAVEIVQHTFGSWGADGQKAMPDLPPVRPLEETVMRRQVIKGKSQADIVIGTLGPRRMDPDYLAASLGNSALGQFGMMGRIGHAVREKAGLAYYAYSSLFSGIGPGTWSVDAGVNPANIKRVTTLVLKELRRFIKSGVTARELADCKANYIGRLPLSMESNGGVASALLNIQRYGLDLEHYRRYPDRIRKVTREDVIEAARRHIDPERLAISLAGPKGGRRKTA